MTETKVQVLLGSQVILEARRDADHWNLWGVEIFNGGVSELKRFHLTFSDTGMVSMLHCYMNELPDHRTRAIWARIAGRL